MVKIYESAYGGWNKCLFMENEVVQLVITLEVGPRIIRYALKGEENVFAEKEDQMGTLGGDSWKAYGGHRLWHAPEAIGRTYPADNFPITYSIEGNSVTVTPPEETHCNIQKEMVITLSEETSTVTVEHRIKNTGAWDVDLALWGITVCAPGGVEIIPEPEHFDALLPNRRISLWPYSRLNDKRLYLGEKYIALTHDAAMDKPFKIGVDNPSGCAAVFVNGCVFIKQYPVEPEVEYPDFGVSFESYICDYMTECESLSPMMRLAPNAVGVHVEQWQLFKEAQPKAEDAQNIESLMKKYF